MKNFANYKVHIIDNAAQLTEALELRYKVYSNVYPKLFRNKTVTSEHDGFDRRSIHIGLYSELEGEKKLAGYCRLILPEFFKARFSNLLIAEHPFYRSEVPVERMSVSARLPRQGSYEKIESLCRQFEQSDSVYIETSRFILAEEHRGLSLMF